MRRRHSGERSTPTTVNHCPTRTTYVGGVGTLQSQARTYLDLSPSHVAVSPTQRNLAGKFWCATGSFMFALHAVERGYSCSAIEFHQLAPLCSQPPSGTAVPTLDDGQAHGRLRSRSFSPVVLHVLVLDKRVRTRAASRRALPSSRGVFGPGASAKDACLVG